MLADGTASAKVLRWEHKLFTGLVLAHSSSSPPLEPSIWGIGAEGLLPHHHLCLCTTQEAQLMVLGFVYLPLWGQW